MNFSLTTMRHPLLRSLLFLGMASGLPLALTSGTLQAWMTIEGRSLKEIGYATLVGQAYVFKFLWAPFFDRFTPTGLAPKNWGRRRAWLLVLQFLLVLALVAMASFNPKNSLTALVIAAVLVAFLSASLDVVFDAYRADSLPADLRGLGAATSVLGYRLAMLLSGGFALWWADRVAGWPGMYLTMAALMGVLMIATYLAPEPETSAAPPRTLRETVVEPWLDFFAKPQALFLLLLIILYKLGDAFAGSLSTAFLLKALGFSAGDVGLANKVMGLIATLVGAFVGALWMMRLGLYRSLLIFGILQMVSNLGYWWLSVNEPYFGSMVLVIGLENLCGGMGTTAFVALLMSWVNPRFSAAQFALLSALAAIGRVYVGPVTGYWVTISGWPTFFGWTVVLAIPGLLVLVMLRKEIEYRT